MNCIVIYHSSTGFTAWYAQQLAEALGGRAVPVKEARRALSCRPDVAIFGTRAHCGQIDKLRRGVRLLRESGAPECAIFVTGAAAPDARETVAQLWSNNLPKAGAQEIPHFYLPAGLCYEKMNGVDRLLMKGLASMLRSKKNKTDADRLLEQSIASSFDISAPEHLAAIEAWAEKARGRKP